MADEAGIGFVASPCGALEFLLLAGDVLDQVPPFVDVPVDIERSQALGAPRDNELRAALVELGDDPLGIERLAGDQHDRIMRLGALWRAIA